MDDKLRLGATCWKIDLSDGSPVFEYTLAFYGSPTVLRSLTGIGLLPRGDFYDAAKYASDHIRGPMHGFIVGVVLPHQNAFALLIGIGETLVGVSLVLGLLTCAGAAGGMFLSLNYYLATGKYQFLLGVESLELLLFISCLMLLALPSGRALSADAAIQRLRARTAQPKPVEI